MSFLRMIQGNFKGVSSKIKGIQVVLRGFQWYFKEV